MTKPNSVIDGIDFFVNLTIFLNLNWILNDFKLTLYHVLPTQALVGQHKTVQNEQVHIEQLPTEEITDEQLQVLIEADKVIGVRETSNPVEQVEQITESDELEPVNPKPNQH